MLIHEIVKNRLCCWYLSEQVRTMNLLVTRLFEFPKPLLDCDKLVVMNEFKPRNIEEYAKNRKFRLFLEAVDASPWSVYYKTKRGIRKKQRAALAFVLWSICLAVYRGKHGKILAPLRNLNDSNRSFWDYFQILRGVAFIFSSSHKTKGVTFKVENVTFKTPALQSCIKWLVETTALVKWEKGYNMIDKEENGGRYEKINYKHGFVYFNLSLFQEKFYDQVEALVGELIDSVSTPPIKPNIEFRHRVEVKPSKKTLNARERKLKADRERRLEEKIDNAASDEEIEEIIRKADSRKRKPRPPKPKYQWVECEDVPKYKRSLWKKNYPYLKMYTQNLDKITLSMGRYENLSDSQKDNVKKEWLDQKNEKQEFNKREYNRELLFLYFLLSETVSPTVPHAVYHLEGRNWLMGRIYGNKGIDGIKREFTPLIKINGEFATSIDIKSSYVQTYVLAKTKENPRQDFYEYEKLKDVHMNRKDMKLFTLIRLNAETEGSAIKAYNTNRRRGANTLNKKKLGELSDLIKKQRPYVSQLYGKPKVFKEIQKIESDFMIKVGKELLKRKIPYLHHCDAMYVRISDREETIRVFEDISEQEFGRKIYLGWSDYQEEGTN